MFHAHVQEFTDLGWMGLFDVKQNTELGWKGLFNVKQS
jgi:hypothetical protein